MKTSFVTRALAATAALGIALILPATAASAQTVSPVAPPVIPPIGIGIGTTPTIQIGTTPTATAAAPTTATATAGTTPSATVTPAPGIRTTVPATATADATAGNPLPGLLVPVAPALGAVPGLAGVPGLATLGQPILADADVQANACIAAALLTGQPVSGCPSTVSGQPTLVDALSTVGICARAKILTGTPIAPCGATAGTSGAGTTPTLSDVAADTNLCLVASVLGGTTNPCPATDSTGSDGATDPSTVATTLDACIGAAVLTNSDLTPCTTSTALSHNPGTDLVAGTQSTGISGTDGGGSGSGANGTTARDAALDLSTASAGDGNLATPLGTLPFTGLDAGAMVLLALALVSSGVAMRRLRAEHRGDPDSPDGSNDGFRPSAIR